MADATYLVSDPMAAGQTDNLQANMQACTAVATACTAAWAAS